MTTYRNMVGADPGTVVALAHSHDHPSSATLARSSQTRRNPVYSGAAAAHTLGTAGRILARLTQQYLVYPHLSAKSMLGRWISTIVILFTLTHSAQADVSVSGTLQKWYPITIDNHAADLTLDATQEQPNPFLDIRYDVILQSPTGVEYQVPGYFAGDGLGGEIGSVWRAKFSANEVGEWQYRISFVEGTDIAVSEEAGDALLSDGISGSFTVVDQNPIAPGFLARGRLTYTGDHYFKFADGPYFIKGGVDSPENFFGYAGFDNTINQPGGIHTRGLVDDVHHYEPHIADWQEGDPLFTNSANPDGAKGIIGAINYLASESVNSIYFLPMNLGGDGQETYPFISPSGSHFDNTRYDISKLYQWGIVLDHMQRKGIVAHLVLAETEDDNTNWFDSGELGVERKLFYREMVARFAHLMAVKWNLSEESKFRTARHEAFAWYIRNLDWANHPIAVHSMGDRPHVQYNGILGNQDFTASSIQFSPENAGSFVEEWRAKSTEAGWPWVIDMDEVGPASEGLNPDNTEALRKSVLYPVYFSGGNLEWYFGRHDLPVGGDLRTEDFRSREQMFRYMKYARNLLQSELPFWEMEPADDTYTNSASDIKAEVFSKAGSAYAVYLASANSVGSLAVQPGAYRQRWFNPRSGSFEGADATVIADQHIELGSAPNDAAEDWVVLLTKVVDETSGPEDPTTAEEQTEPSETTEPADTADPVESTDTASGAGLPEVDEPAPALPPIIVGGTIDRTSLLFMAFLLTLVTVVRRKRHS